MANFSLVILVFKNVTVTQKHRNWNREVVEISSFRNKSPWRKKNPILWNPNLNHFLRQSSQEMLSRTHKRICIHWVAEQRYLSKEVPITIYSFTLSRIASLFFLFFFKTNNELGRRTLSSRTPHPLCFWNEDIPDPKKHPIKDWWQEKSVLK